MQLVLKLPKNKAPFVGILFTGEDHHKGERLHAEIVEQFAHCQYDIIFEHCPSTLNMRLLCQERVVVYFYNHLGFDPQQLKSWLYFTKNAQSYTFGHVGNLLGKDELMLSQPARKKFFVKVKSVKFLVAEDPDEMWNLPFTLSNRKW